MSNQFIEIKVLENTGASIIFHLIKASAEGVTGIYSPGGTIWVNKFNPPLVQEFKYDPSQHNYYKQFNKGWHGAIRSTRIRGNEQWVIEDKFEAGDRYER
jgi:hypothetical protein